MDGIRKKETLYRPAVRIKGETKYGKNSIIILKGSPHKDHHSALREIEILREESKGHGIEPGTDSNVEGIVVSAETTTEYKVNDYTYKGNNVLEDKNKGKIYNGRMGT